MKKYPLVVILETVKKIKRGQSDKLKSLMKWKIFLKTIIPSLTQEYDNYDLP